MKNFTQFRVNGKTLFAVKSGTLTLKPGQSLSSTTPGIITVGDLTVEFFEPTVITNESCGVVSVTTNTPDGDPVYYTSAIQNATDTDDLVWCVP